jgi:hypothetical protein
MCNYHAIRFISHLLLFSHSAGSARAKKRIYIWQSLSSYRRSLSIMVMLLFSLLFLFFRRRYVLGTMTNLFRVPVSPLSETCYDDRHVTVIKARNHMFKISSLRVAVSLKPNTWRSTCSIANEQYKSLPPFYPEHCCFWYSIERKHQAKHTKLQPALANMCQINPFRLTHIEVSNSCKISSVDDWPLSSLLSTPI